MDKRVSFVDAVNVVLQKGFEEVALLISERRCVVFTARIVAASSSTARCKSICGGDQEFQESQSNFGEQLRFIGAASVSNKPSQPPTHTPRYRSPSFYYLIFVLLAYLFHLADRLPTHFAVGFWAQSIDVRFSLGKVGNSLYFKN
ncbi:hypothetical protein KC19_VG154600 [Ceratodon purpureus]|uniref:Uncharacterized protein n=1 Tax=Ceratodon purpureus TaxID=3225 RepID=A0A8T0HRI3_CERPU|nr:hypothetical protein KC19_VG154600 [Ceratodon purpureus]